MQDRLGEERERSSGQVKVSHSKWEESVTQASVDKKQALGWRETTTGQQFLLADRLLPIGNFPIT